MLATFSSTYSDPNASDLDVSKKCTNCIKFWIFLAMILCKKKIMSCFLFSFCALSCFQPGYTDHQQSGKARKWDSAKKRDSMKKGECEQLCDWPPLSLTNVQIQKLIMIT